ncbi:ferritin family protein [Draconibacterium halophilum]|uniref:Rubrerythrin n=1 Tax=Draconibacterium halophilum TaxID=2706887 RepID=A0A6C0R7Z8_9BACT|nr:ferritin family protein [Draconibacterium halophilum]QIA06463.1 rubrerythrin [Draconibacterium halophilum]QIA06464.1 rubrerythrin [Draconibacterium halophilum]
MTAEQKEQLIKSQQGELNAVLIYQRLARITKHEKGEEVFSEIAADEGKHATILKSYTNEVLKPDGKKAKVVGFLYKLLGHNFVMGLLEKGELKSIDNYEPLKNDFPKIQQIIDDELRHAAMAKSLLR